MLSVKISLKLIGKLYNMNTSTFSCTYCQFSNTQSVFSIFDTTNQENLEFFDAAGSVEADLDSYNLTSLHEVLLDEREMASDEDKDYVQEVNTYSELMPTYENLPADNVPNSSQTSEKGIDELRKVCLYTFIAYTGWSKVTHTLTHKYPKSFLSRFSSNLYQA